MWFEGDREAREKKTKNWKIEVLREKSSELGMSILFVTSVSIGPGGTLELWGNLSRDSFQQLDAETGTVFFTKFSKYFPKSSKFDF